jgi:hypothetical protein
MYPNDLGNKSLRALAELTEERPAEVLPTLRNLSIEAPRSSNSKRI